MSIEQTNPEQVATKKPKAIEHQKLKEKLLGTLESTESIPFRGASTEDALYEIRKREFNHLLSLKD